MEDPPKPSDEPILPRRGWYSIFGYGGLITVSVMLGMDEKNAVTISFLTLAFAQLWNIFNMRGEHTTLTNNDIVQNSFVWMALVLSVGLLLLAVYMPFLANLMQLGDPGIKGWLLVITASSMTCVVGQLFRKFAKK